jgi:predicted nucleotidyltransferase
MSSEGAVDVLLNAMKVAAGTLRDRDIPFALAGGLAVYARGGPETDHDVDFVIRRDDAERALEVLDEAGFRCEKPPENWLYKVYDSSDAMIDLIFAPNNDPGVVDEIIDRAEELEVYAIRMKVMSVTDVLATKLLALKEHEVDYEGVLTIARSCREQVEWGLLRERVGDHPYSQAFFTLVESLGLAPQAA